MSEPVHISVAIREWREGIDHRAARARETLCMCGRCGRWKLLSEMIRRAKVGWVCKEPCDRELKPQTEKETLK